jgi:hypothetical protein
LCDYTHPNVGFLVRRLTDGSGISIFESSRGIVSLQMSQGPIREELGKLTFL